jgi:hypothetical protein
MASCLLEETIRYYDEDSWQKYFAQDLAELYSTLEGLLKLRDEIINKLQSDTVGNLIKESNIYKEILFGGFRADENKPFVDNALALFYKNILGIGLGDRDISIIIGRIKEGLPLETATEDIHCCTIEQTTKIIEILREMSSRLKSIYKKLSNVIEEPKPKEYKITSSTVGLMAFRDLLNAAKKLLPLYNPLSFFIMSLYSVPKFYVAEAYEKLFDQQVQNVLEKYDIRLIKLLEPDIPDEKIRGERLVIGLQDGSVGHLIRDIILWIYALFQHNAVKQFFNIEDEFNKYVSIYINKLKESIVTNEF